MQRIHTLLGVVLLVLTFQMLRLVHGDVRHLRAETIRAQAFAPPEGFRALTADGKPYRLREGRRENVGLFVIHAAELGRELPRWNALQQALAPQGVELVATCDRPDCVRALRASPVAPKFVVLAGASFPHARSLALLDGRQQWLLCERGGRIRGVLPVPGESNDVSVLARVVSRSLEEVQRASLLDAH